MMHTFRPFILWGITILFVVSTGGYLLGQNFPVRASVTLINPSPYLEDYAREGNLLVVLTLVDNRPSYQGFLRITIEGDGFFAQNNTQLFQQPITLNRGQPLILRGPDLAPYFNLNNLDVSGFGLDNTLNNGGNLPDGPITICAEFYDLNRFDAPPVSNPACATRFVQQRYPPELVAPLGEQDVLPQTVIDFRWTPRHIPQPGEDEYIVEIWRKVPGLALDQIINSTPPITPPITSMVPRYVYTNYDSRVVEGETYVWRVQVRDRTGVRAFINNGYSNPGIFEYGETNDPLSCPSIERFFVQDLAANQAELGWAVDDTLGLGGYQLRYRPIEAPEWTALPSPQIDGTSSLIEQLQEETAYEAELCIVCQDGSLRCDYVTFETIDPINDCGPFLNPITVPVADDALSISWDSIGQATGFRLTWKEVVSGPLPSPNPAPSPNAPQRQGRGRTQVPAPRAAPRTSAPSPTSSSPPTVDSLRLPAGAIQATIDGLMAGKTYEIQLCKLCPDGTEECYQWNATFEGVDEECLLALNFTRPDSTATTLDLAWTYPEGVTSANDSFTLIWQLADRSGPERIAVLAYEQGSYTITGRLPGQSYTLKVCAECRFNEPVCRDLPPFGGCPAEYDLELLALDFKKALLGYDTSSLGDREVELRYGMRAFPGYDSLGINNLVDFSPLGQPYGPDQLSETPKLSPQVVYGAQIRNVCFDSLWSAWSPPVEFSLACATNQPLSAENITDEGAQINGVPLANAAYYQIFYRLADSLEGPWVLLDELDSPNATLTGLLADTTYEVKMRFWCTLGVWSDETDILTFRTLPPCGEPFNGLVDPILATAATIGWQEGQNALTTTLRYRRLGGTSSPRTGRDQMGRMPFPGGASTPTSTPWEIIDNLDSLVHLQELEGGARYEFQLQSDCGVNLSEWAPVATFTLLCAPPEQLAVDELTYESARAFIAGLSPTAQSHEFSYRLLGDSSWTTISSPTGEVDLLNLDDLATYEIRVRTRCEAGQFSVWSDTLQFDTPVKCLVPENLGLAHLTHDRADVRWDVTGTVTRWEVRFLDTYSAVPTAAQQTAVPLPGGGESPGPPRSNPSVGNPSSPPGPPGTPQQPATPNRNGGLIPGSPRIPASPGPAAPPPNPYASWQTFITTDPSKVFEQLSPNRRYKVVVRAECPTYGWTDYTDVLDFKTLCRPDVPDTAWVTNVLEQEATINWDRVTFCLEEYRVVIESLEPLSTGQTTMGSEQAPGRTESRQGGIGNRTPAGQSTVTSGIYRDSVTTTEEFHTFTGLRANTEYRVRIKARINQSEFDAGPNGYLTMEDWVALGASAGAPITGSAAWHEYTPWYIFRTDHCAQPYDFVEESLSRSSIAISWTPSNGINDYEFKYKLADDPGASWAFLNVTEPYVVLENLLGNAIYDYQVTELCQNGTTVRPAPQDSFLMKKPSLNNGLYVCGLATVVDLTNETPLPALFPGDTIWAFDFPVVITEVTGGGGVFSGVGEIRVPYFNKAKMQFVFDGIFVNDEYRMVGGFLEATGFGIEVLPPWADSLLNEIISGLEALDGALADQQVEILDSLMNCCQNHLPQSLQDTINAILDCFEQNPDDPVAAGCTDRLDSLMTYIGENLDSIVESLDTQIVTSLTVDIIREAMIELADERGPTLPGVLTNYQNARATLNSNFPTLTPTPNTPNYLGEATTLDPGGGGTTGVTQFGNNAVGVRTAALTLTEVDMFVNTEPKLPGVMDIKNFALPQRTGDTDVFTPIHNMVSAIWYDGDSGPDFDRTPLIAEAKILLAQKYNFLVNE
ncbi:fibronectin type III domain-containing protein [Lewinella sp. W8]|uniref:fibronectin type III domain-containing protein n=1 Tax=Lewinella sp. W8 TaxID=2528208 RepID=UPI0010676871|nr:fibronectin type III domain-containing protein [Lewinella sp. W8]MTB52350.1 hypothetical protein [Lewinella sp. W8]